MKCVKCDKEMSIDGIDYVGTSLQINCPEPSELLEHLEKQLGKYEVGHTYNFCWECWLDSLFQER